MKKAVLAIALAALVVALPTMATAQPISDFRSLPLATLYDLDATTLTYCRTTGAANLPLGDNRLTRIPITIAANSTTVLGTAAFTNILVGDILYLVDPAQPSRGAVLEKVVTARASANSITISSVVSVGTALSQQSFEWRKLDCATTAAAGWIPVEAFRPVKFSIAVNQMSVTSGGINIRIECREQGEDNQPFRVYPATGFTNYTAAGIDSRLSVGLSVYDMWRECRVGLQFSGTDDGVDTGVNLEQVTMRIVLAR